MLRKTYLGIIVGLGLTISAAAEDVIVRIAPPHAVVERRPHRPSREYIWTSGYQRWDGNRYVWVGGRWDRPPHRGARWVPHHWERRHGGWVFVEGHWR